MMAALPLLACAMQGLGVRDAAAAEDKRLFIYNWSDFIGLGRLRNSRSRLESR